MLKRIVSLLLTFSIFTAHTSGGYYTNDNSTVILPPFTNVKDVSDAVFDGEIQIKDGVIKTGNTLKLSDGSKTAIVLCDISGDGLVNSTDYIQLRRYYLGLFSLSSASLTAADCNMDGKINSTDYIIIRNTYLRTYSFNSTPPFSSQLSSSGAVIPKNELAPTAKEICLTNLSINKYINYYLALDFSNSSYGYFDLAVLFPVAGLTVIISDGEYENKFILSESRLNEPLRFNFCYGEGQYNITAKASVNGKSFTVLNFNVDAKFNSTFNPFLVSAYPTVYNGNSKFVIKANEICSGLNSDFEKIAACYSYLADTQKYKYTVSTDEYKYLPNLDDIYERKYGVCWDFCAALAAMLRSQGIPCKIAIGFAYGITNFGHAWVEVYTEENGYFENDYLKVSNGWSLLDITASICRSDKKEAKAYIESMSSTYSAFKYF